MVYQMPSKEDCPYLYEIYYYMQLKICISIQETMNFVDFSHLSVFRILLIVYGSGYKINLITACFKRKNDYFIRLFNSEYSLIKHSVVHISVTVFPF